jgi:hypothetical protein
MKIPRNILWLLIGYHSYVNIFGVISMLMFFVFVRKHYNKNVYF